MRQHILNIDITFNILCLICLVKVCLYRNSITLSQDWLYRGSSDLIEFPRGIEQMEEMNNLPSSLYESSR